MQTAVKQSQPKTIAESGILPKSVKKAIQQVPTKKPTDPAMSGDLSRLLDANSDCV